MFRWPLWEALVYGQDKLKQLIPAIAQSAVAVEYTDYFSAEG